LNARFDPIAKEQQLRADSASWDTGNIRDATADDIPVIDLSGLSSGSGSGSASDLERIAQQLRLACEQVGFFLITGHGVSPELIAETFDHVREYHARPLDEKLAIQMDRPDWPHGGMGYLPHRNGKLPSREKANFNEAFLIKRDHQITFDDNQWPRPADLPAFRGAVEKYAQALTSLGKSMLPAYARALNMPADFFDQAFVDPMYRLRMTHYPALEDSANQEFGINPHVDTTFCTILAQDAPGLTIYSERDDVWLNVPMRDDAFVVNTGELLRQWTNDRFISVKHFANNNTSNQSRYSIPFFFNANADYVMHPIASCVSPDNPARYAPVSYSSSQATIQGE
jgi:isopenicillin N synthase-like dioxygenase